MRPLVPTALHDHYRPLNATLNAAPNDNDCVFLAMFVSRLFINLYELYIHSFFVPVLLSYVFLPSRHNIIHPYALQTTPNPSAAPSENVSLVHKKLYVVFVFTSEVNMTFVSRS